MGTGKDRKSVDCEERCLARYSRGGIRTMYSLIQFVVVFILCCKNKNNRNVVFINFLSFF